MVNSEFPFTLSFCPAITAFCTWLSPINTANLPHLSKVFHCSSFWLTHLLWVRLLSYVWFQFFRISIVRCIFLAEPFMCRSRKLPDNKPDHQLLQVGLWVGRIYQQGSWGQGIAWNAIWKLHIVQWVGIVRTDSEAKSFYHLLAG